MAKRLLVKDERGGEVVVEVALESLLRQWDALAGWLREETTDLKDADVLDQAVHAWTQSGFNEDWLLEGARLTDAESLAAKPGFRDRLNTAREFLLASRQRQDRRAEAALRAARERQDAAEKLVETERRAKQDAERRSRVLRSVLVLTFVLAVVAAVCAGWALHAKNEARERFLDATAQRLRATSQASVSGQSPKGEESDHPTHLQRRRAHPGHVGWRPHAATVEHRDIAAYRRPHDNDAVITAAAISAKQADRGRGPPNRQSSCGTATEEASLHWRTKMGR